MTLAQLGNSKLTTHAPSPCWWESGLNSWLQGFHPVKAPVCSSVFPPTASLESSGSQPQGDHASQGSFGQFWRHLCHSWGCGGGCCSICYSMKHSPPERNRLARKAEVLGLYRHCGLVSVPGFYSLNTSSSHPRPHPLQVTISRMSPDITRCPLGRQDS